MKLFNNFFLMSELYLIYFVKTSTKIKTLIFFYFVCMCYTLDKGLEINEQVLAVI